MRYSQVLTITAVAMTLSVAAPAFAQSPAAQNTQNSGGMNAPGQSNMNSGMNSGTTGQKMNKTSKKMTKKQKMMPRD